VVGFDDLDVPVLAEAARGFLDQPSQHVDPQRGVAGLEHGDLFRCMVDQPVVAFLQPGRADQDGFARGHGGVQIGLQRGGLEKSISTSLASARASTSPSRSIPPATVCPAAFSASAMAWPMRPALPMMPMLAMCCPLSKLCRRVMAPNAAGRNWRV
jgi:hypothetical protein